ncbi:hypothetical protein C8F01DRAFT_1255783 [Mycena amicta]|nr:hypothetical protein C8F01DRAFT_1255783 [Mycena amicta]
MSSKSDANPDRLAGLPSDLKQPYITPEAKEVLGVILASLQTPSEAVHDEHRRSPRFASNDSPVEPTIPADASLVRAPNSLSKPTSPKTKHQRSNHRPAPQVQITVELDTEHRTPRKVTPDERADSSGSCGKRGGVVEGLPPPPSNRHVPSSIPSVTLPGHPPTVIPKGKAPTALKEKQDAFLKIKERTMGVELLHELAATFSGLVDLMYDHRNSAPIVACFDALRATQSRLDAIHEFPRDAESPESFSAILTKSVAAPMQILAGQLQAQHKAIQSLTKSMDSSKNAGSPTYASVTAAPAQTPTKPTPTPSVPITSTPDKRILIRCDGDLSPILSRPFHEIVKHVNAVLAPLDLPQIACVSRTKDGGLFLVPDAAECAKILTSSWSNWGPTLFPTACIIPPSVHSHIQLDGIVHAAAPNLEEIALELNERYPQLGPVVGLPVWVNKPPSEAQIASTRSAGGKPRTAGSIWCLVRKAKATELRQRAIDLNTYLNSASSVAPINSWKLRNLLDIFAGDFDIICIQEPNANESLHAHAHDSHCVSVLVKLSSIPASSICPRPDLSQSGDIVVIDFALGLNRVTLINLYNDCKTRAGIGLFRFALARLEPRTKILLVLDSNSHHPSWDSKTKIQMRYEDYELHDLLVMNRLLLVTPPDVPTYISGNVIDLGFCLPSLFMAINATVDSALCVGSDHLPIFYELNFDVTISQSIKFNSDKIDLNAFLGILWEELGRQPLPVITTRDELDKFVHFLNKILLAAMEGSTPRHRPSSMAKR